MLYRKARVQTVTTILAATALLVAFPALEAAAAEKPAALADAGRIGGDFKIIGQKAGFHEPAAFLEFLRDAREGREQKKEFLVELFERNSLLFILAVLGGGLLLNLTPCVLPMIPINLGIIGAGVQASSRSRGFLLGGTYGLGITVAYGSLGLFTLATGAAFGMLQSNPWFNLAIAAVFIALALALFDVFIIDFSRFQSTGAPSKAGSYGAAFGIGAVSALLAGACVAPVLISTLMIASGLYQNGQNVGLLLPFLLGLGMAIPWPFAGAGLSFLPRPGAWMNRIKQAFGILVLGFALYYGTLSVRGFRAAAPERPATDSAESIAATEPGATEPAGAIPWRKSLSEALDESEQSGKPVMTDLWATWCTACRQMERRTLGDESVIAEIAEHFIPVKVQCEVPSEPETKALMNALGAKGLPTFTIIQPGRNP